MKKLYKKSIFKGSSEKGITLTVLIITIITMMILVAITFSMLISDDGVITKAKMSTFCKELSEIKEKVDLKKSSHAAELIRSSSDEAYPDFDATLFIEKFNTNETSKYKVKDTLLREIVYARAGFPSEVDISSYGEDDFDELVNDDGTITNVFVIDRETADGNEDTYIWDRKTDIVYKISPTLIGLNIYHSYVIAALGINNTENEVTFDLIIEDDPQFIGEECAYYEPDLTGYSKTATKIIYYSQTYLNEANENSNRQLNRSDYIELPVSEYFNKSKPAKLLGSEFPVDGQTINNEETYIFHDYANRIWGNVKTDSSGLECWWVWIPRYAYKINGENSTPPIDVKFIDLTDKMVHKQDLPTGYIKHPAFTETQIKDGDETTVKELKGIWMSKYEPSNSYSYVPESEGCYAPDMTGFDEDYTDIELYDTVDKQFKDTVQLKSANLSTINTQYQEQNEIWYDYSNNIWANIKTYNNNLECWWVWIPRYAYKITDGITESNIIFIDLKDRPIDKAKYGNKLPDGFIVHPAFKPSGTDGEKNLKGIWVSKYEPSNNTSQRNPISNVCYKPNMDGFDPNNTYIEIYDSAGNTIVEEKLLKNVDLSTINNGNVWYDYLSHKWANIKTYANGLECWWVWIPRYAYNLTTGITESEVLFTDLDNKPIDKVEFGDMLQACYIPHPAFTETEINEEGKEVIVKELEGIWMSKYEPSNQYNYIPMSTSNYAPDMTGFDENNTYIEIYDSAGNSVVEEKLLKNVDLSTVNNGNAWYDYSNKKWANIKTYANGLECWWVWIPRYAYKLIEGQTNVTEVNIIFIDENNAPIEKDKYGNTLPDGFTVHPAFNPSGEDGSKNLKGIWMSKYEPSWVQE